MRRRVNRKCCLFGIGFLLLLWMIFNLVRWEVKLSAEWNQPQKLSLRARKNLLVKKFKSREQGVSVPVVRHCDELTEVFNKALVKWYNQSVLYSLGVVSDPEDQRARDEGYQKFAFNALISNKVGFHRALPDTRDKKCQDVIFPSIHLDTTIVICFYNELPSALLRTVHSIIDRSPQRLIREIILVDDSSTLEEIMVKYRTDQQLMLA